MTDSTDMTGGRSTQDPGAQDPETPDTGTQDPGADGGGSPTRLALMLGAGLLALVLLLSLLAPSEVPVDESQLAQLVEAGHVAGVEIAGDVVRARLHAPVLIEVDGQRYRSAEVRLEPAPPGFEARLRGWEGAAAPGFGIVRRLDRPPSSLREIAWMALVAGLLLFGMAHLVLQARRHRREGSPRERLDEARADLEAGRISPEEYERRASAIAVEL